MSTTLLDEDSPEYKGVLLNRFYGGHERGTCYQITISRGDYVQLTEAQMASVVHAWLGAKLGITHCED